MDENDRLDYIKYFQEVEGKDFDHVIRIQVQSAVKETARLVGLLEEGYKLAGIDSPEYKKLRDNGQEYLNHLIHIAKRLQIQIQ